MARRFFPTDAFDLDGWRSPPPATCPCCDGTPRLSRCCCAESQLPPTLHATIIPIDTSLCCGVGMVTFPLTYRTAPYNLLFPFATNCLPPQIPGQPLPTVGYWAGSYTTANRCEVGGATCRDVSGLCAGDPGLVPDQQTPCTFSVLWSPGGCCFWANVQAGGLCCVPVSGPAAPPGGTCNGYILLSNTGIQMTTPNCRPGGTPVGPYVPNCAGGNLPGTGVSCADGSAALDCGDLLPLEYITLPWYSLVGYPSTPACGVIWTGGYTPGVGIDFSNTATYKCRTRLVISL